MIYIIRQEGLCQNKVNSNLVFTCNCKMGYLHEKVFPYHLSLLPSLTWYKALGCHVSKLNDCDIRAAKPLMVTNILSGDHSIISGPQKATLNKA